jgi:hypothetical protein
MIGFLVSLNESIIKVSCVSQRSLATQFEWFFFLVEAPSIKTTRKGSYQNCVFV